MNRVKTKGFTVIEILLFLSITGLMIATMVTSTSVSLNNQRYRDAVVSLKMVIQEQYSALSSTQNDRSSEDKCSVAGVSETEKYRGQSECEIVGRYMVIKDSKYTLYPVLAYRYTDNKSPTGTDISYMQDESYFRMAVDVESMETESLEWGVRIAWPTAGSEKKSPTTPRNIGILFIKSPDSGQVYTFTSNTVPSDLSVVSEDMLRNMIKSSANTPDGQGARSICVNSNGFAVQANSFIYINPYAASASAIESLTSDNNEGTGTKC